MSGWRVIACCLFLLNSAVTWAQQPENKTTGVATTTARVDRQEADASFVTALREIAAWCHTEQQGEYAQKTLANFLVRDPGRLYIFLPTETKFPPSSATQDFERKWYDKIQAARNDHAIALWELAREAADRGQGAEAYQWVHEVLHWNPEFEAARTALGHRLVTEGWQPYSERAKVKRPTRKHALTGWESGTYIQVTTDNFNVISAADEATTLKLSEQLQRWEWVWRQVFFDYWSNAQTLLNKLDGKSPGRNSTKKYDVVFFADRDSYISTLRQHVPQIVDSTGYYSEKLQTSFFYAGNEVDSWRHELTHQLFQESVRTSPIPFDQNFIWLGEGIAIYMESLLDFGPFATLGGFDSASLQYARMRQFRENFQVPLTTLNTMTQTAFLENSDVRRLYSQSAGLTHFFMHAEQGALRPHLIELLDLIYHGKVKPTSFEKILKRSGQQIDLEYPNFLRVDNRTLVDYLLVPEGISQLALSDSHLDDDGFAVIGRCRQLRWLDISGNDPTTSQLQALSACGQLRQLFLTRSKMSAGTLSELQALTQLQNLDLSHSILEPAAFSELALLTNLQELGLAGTNADDSIIEILIQLKDLKAIDLSATAVTPAGLDRLKQARPDLNIRQ